MNEHSQHHLANLAVIALPLSSWWLNAPLFLSITAGILSVIYYSLLIAKTLMLWKKDRHDGKVS